MAEAGIVFTAKRLEAGLSFLVRTFTSRGINSLYLLESSPIKSESSPIKFESFAHRVSGSDKPNKRVRKDLL